VTSLVDVEVEEITDALESFKSEVPACLALSELLDRWKDTENGEELVESSI
jgi:hypothetical protein